MGGLSKVIVIDADARARHQLGLGFAREGVRTASVAVPADPARLELPVDDVPPGAVIVGGSDDRVLAVVKRVSEVLAERQQAVPIVFAGRGVRRADVEMAGAHEVLLVPAYLRDVVTVGRLVQNRTPAALTKLGGSLAELTGVLTLLRALSALGRSAALTMMRGLRRGEVRFFRGEITSAQVGLIHGQAALHQLLLWTDATFEYRHEDVVRRQQIPMSHDELFADAERFLAGVRESSGALSPSMVLEQDVQRVQAFGKQIPTAVHGVLRMFDGHRVLADVLEDSPYRVFETLRVAQRAMDVGLLRQQSATRKKATWRAVLAIEEWLVGSEAPERLSGAAEVGPLTQTASRDSQRLDSHRHTGGGGRRKRKHRRANTPVAVPIVRASGAAGEIDWGSLVPRVVGAEVGPLAGVVPASNASGEILSPTRDEPREGLEAVMNTAKRERMFASDLGAEPSVVLADPAKVADDAARAQARAEAESDARDHADAVAVAKVLAAKGRLERDAVAAAEAEVAARATRDAHAAQAAGALAAKVETPAVVATETPSATVTVSDRMTVHYTEETARLVSEPAATVTETLSATAPAVDTEPAKRPSSGAPTALSDDPSDGVPRDGATTAETAPLPYPSAAARVPSPVDDDRPEAKTGEIAHRAAKPSTPPALAQTEESILITELPSVQSTTIPAIMPKAQPAPSKRAAKAAKAAAKTGATAKPVTASAPVARALAEPVTVAAAPVATAKPAAPLKPTRAADATAVFSDDEEDFFRAGQADTGAVPKQASDSFDDLDAGYEKQTFWSRLLGPKKKR